jgi:hypothetical protein
MLEYTKVLETNWQGLLDSGESVASSLKSTGFFLYMPVEMIEINQ